MPYNQQIPNIDIHTRNASLVASHTYFTIADFSSNENPGLLVGTEVKKIREPEPRPSKYWNGSYWTCFVECPNGEVRKVCCDVLTPRPDGKLFAKQQTIFSTKVA